jgi:RNA polymerase sigma-70 factor (subfamily 1)
MIRGVAYSSDGKFALSASGDINDLKARGGGEPDNSVRLWDARRGKQLRMLKGFKNGLASVAFSPGGRYAVLSSAGKWVKGRWVPGTDHSVRLWDVETNREMFLTKVGGADDGGGPKADDPQGTPRFRGHTGDVACVAFSPRADRVAGGGADGMVLVWEADTGKEVCRFRASNNVVHSLAFTPDGRQIVTGDYRHQVRLWDGATGAALHTFLSHTDIVFGVAVAAGKDGAVYALSGGGSQVSPFGRGFIPGTRDYEVRLWDLGRRQEVRRLRGHTGEVMSVAFAPNGRHALSSSFDKTVRLWDLDTGKELRCFREHTDHVRAVAVSPDGRWALSGSDEGDLRFWELPLEATDLTRALKERDAKLLARAAGDIDTMGPAANEAVPALLAALKAGPAGLRPPALAALRRLTPPGQDAVPALADLLAAPDREVRALAAQSLGRLGPDAKSAVPALLERFGKAEEPADLLALAETLGRVGAKGGEVVRALSGALKHPDPEVRQQLALALRRLGPDAIDTDLFLKLALADPSAAVRRLADEALRERLASFSEANLPAVRALLKDARHPRAALYGLDVVVRLRGAAAEALPELTPLLQHDDAGVRSRALAALAALGKAARPALPALVQSLPKIEAGLRVQAAVTLAAIDPQDDAVAAAVVPVLVGALAPAAGSGAAGGKLKGQILDALAAIGTPATGPIFQALEEAKGRGKDKAEHRKALFEALRKLGRKAYSEENVARVKAMAYSRDELYQDVKEARRRRRRALYPMTNAPAWDLGKYRPLVRLLARGLLRDWPQLRRRLDQSDLTNSVLLKAHENLGQFRGATEEDLLKWLRVILVNQFRDVCRHEHNLGHDPALERSLDEAVTRSSVRLGAFLEASQPSPSENAERREALAALSAALESLPEDEYEALVAHDLEGESFRAIAQRLGVSPATVLWRADAARKRLRERLAGHDLRGGS